MIKRELYNEETDDIKLYRTYSDKGYKIKQVETGIIYAEAIDTEKTNYTYEETNIKIKETNFDEKEKE